MKKNGEKIRLLVISLYTQFGGGEYGIYYLLKHIDRQRFEPILLTNDYGPLVESAASTGIECVRIPFAVVMLQRLIRPSLFWKNVKASFALRRLIKSRKIEIVQCQDVLSLLLLLPASLTCRVRIVYNVIFFHEPLRIFLLDVLSLFRVSRVAVLSELIRRDTEEKSLFLKKKTRLIYWGVDTERFHPVSVDEKRQLRQKFGLPRVKRIVGFIGRYDLWKGHHTYLKACGQLLKKRSDMCMLVVGGAMTQSVVPAVAKYRREVESAMKELIDHGDLIVWDHRDDVPQVMALIDVLVCPSDREPFGLVVLEAAATRIPTVVSDGAGALEAVEGMKGVYKARAMDPVSFADAIDEALEFDPIEMDIRVVAERCSWKKYVKSYENLYFELFQGK